MSDPRAAPAEPWVDALDALVELAVRRTAEGTPEVIPGGVRAIEPKVWALTEQHGLANIKRALAAHVIALELQGFSEAAGALAGLLRALIASGHREKDRGTRAPGREDEFSP